MSCDLPAEGAHAGRAESVTAPQLQNSLSPPTKAVFRLIGRAFDLAGWVRSRDQPSAQ